ncbi:hypothetical protein [Chryseobacterium sp. G0186]|uniref:hypothetical protein n=1 Tax=Chryseobacterium sp. G0186 TaxID=2487064 RepID=UPI0013DE1BA3|nr:hypothetical protein [Chryseobacterium sp. G0186]
MNNQENSPENNKEIKKEDNPSENIQKKDKQNAKFPDWDILPPHQMIKPRS